MWLDKPEQWEALAVRLRRAGETNGFGYDTETYGQPDKTSPQHRARVHCWSVGVLTDAVHPRGYRRAVGRVLPAAALHYPALHSVLVDPALRKWAHNAPHDIHSTRNEGVDIQGIVDTLQWLRVSVPGMGEYGLKGAEGWALGYPSRPNFKDMMRYQRDVQVVRKSKKACRCGAKPCRKRSNTTWVDLTGHTQFHERVPLTEMKKVEDHLAVTDFVPGASLPPLTWWETRERVFRPSWWKGTPIDRWQAWLDYTVADAVRGVELVSWLRSRKYRELVYPWQSNLFLSP